jgi:ATP-dependent DNA helicase RecG
VLGSGVRNLYRYTKIYSGGEPELVEGDVFRTIVPIDLSLMRMSDNGNLSDNLSDNARYRNAIIAHLAENGEISAMTAIKIIGRSPATARRLLAQLVDEGVVRSGGNRNRKYIVTK